MRGASNTSFTSTILEGASNRGGLLIWEGLLLWGGVYKIIEKSFMCQRLSLLLNGNNTSDTLASCISKRLKN